jgi:hypothetical protein
LFLDVHLARQKAAKRPHTGCVAADRDGHPLHAQHVASMRQGRRTSQRVTSFAPCNASALGNVPLVTTAPFRVRRGRQASRSASRCRASAAALPSPDSSHRHPLVPLRRGHPDLAFRPMVRRCPEPGAAGAWGSHGARWGHDGERRKAIETKKDLPKGHRAGRTVSSVGPQSVAPERQRTGTLLKSYSLGAAGSGRVQPACCRPCRGKCRVAPAIAPHHCSVRIETLRGRAFRTWTLREFSV